MTATALAKVTVIGAGVTGAGVTGRGAAAPG